MIELISVSIYKSNSPVSSFFEILTHNAQPSMIKIIAKKSYLENVSYKIFTESMVLNIIVMEELDASKVKFPFEMAKILHNDPNNSDMKPNIQDFVK